MASRCSEGLESWGRILIVFLAAVVACAGVNAQTQTPAPSPDRAQTEALARRVNERVQALEREAERLAGQSRTLIGELRKLEIDREIRIERVKQTEADVAASHAELQETADRLTAIEQRRVAELPDLESRLVEVYKQGRGGYTRLLLNVRELREFGRATRAVAALSNINQRRLAEHKQTLVTVRKERAALEQKTRELQARHDEARKARAAADRAIAARNALIAQIDARRDLNAQLTGELRVAQQDLQRALADLAAGKPVELVSVPMAPFKGTLAWPVVGRVIARFGPSGRGSTAIVRNGIEIAAPEGTPVRAIHAGVVSYSDVFTGYGTLVIIDHGANQYSLYGYLSSASVERGARVESGDELGRTGFAPAGTPALYFEMRVDGRSVDPVQWLKSR